MSVLWWAGSDPWGQKGSGITQHLHYCSETMLLLCLPELCLADLSGLFFLFKSIPFPPSPILCSHCREELGPLQELRALLFCPKHSLARAVTWQ